MHYLADDSAYFPAVGAEKADFALDFALSWLASTMFERAPTASLSAVAGRLPYTTQLLTRLCLSRWLLDPGLRGRLEDAMQALDPASAAHVVEVRGVLGACERFVGGAEQTGVTAEDAVLGAAAVRLLELDASVDAAPGLGERVIHRVVRLAAAGGDEAGEVEQLVIRAVVCGNERYEGCAVAELQAVLQGSDAPRLAGVLCSPPLVAGLLTHLLSRLGGRGDTSASAAVLSAVIREATASGALADVKGWSIVLHPLRCVLAGLRATSEAHPQLLPILSNFSTDIEVMIPSK